METPILKGRRSVIFRESIVASPLRRSVLNNSVNMEDSTVNEEMERQERRSRVDIQRRLSNLPAANNSPVVTDKECQEHLKSCIQMFTENKISSKNVWNLKIIDYMRKMLFVQTGEKDVLQLATSSLDASTKVYSIRVDDVHSDGMKLASSMARAVTTEVDEAGDQDGNEPSETTTKQPKKKKKKFVRGVKNTIAKSRSAISGGLQKLESTTFQSRALTDSNNGGNSTLFGNVLPTNLEGTTILLGETGAFEFKDTVITECKRNVYKLMDVKGLPICPEYAGFELDDWDPDKADEKIKKILDNELLFDDNGIPIAELDGSLHDMGAEAPMNLPSSDEENMDCEEFAIQKPCIENIVSLRPTIQSIITTDEYSYHSRGKQSEKFLTFNWVGPSHWKLKHIRRTASRFSGKLHKQAPAKIVKSTKKAPVKFSLDNDDFEPVDFSNICTKKINPNTDPSKITLPPIAEQYNFTTMLLSKNVSIESLKTVETPQEDYNAGTYNYENPNDSNYCAQNAFDDNNDSNNFDDNQEEEVVVGQEKAIGENLIDAPAMVQKNYIQYAQQAKKMDMRKLKTVLWKSIITSEALPFENIQEDDMKKASAQTCNFSEILKVIPDRINEKMREELSCPLAFFAVLHLANEHNLRLTSSSDLKDFRIEQDFTN